MRRRMLLGLSLAVAAPSVTLAQFAAERPMTGTPAAPSAPTPSAPHPWAVKPEHGGWMICIKSYTGPDSKKKAEELAGEIRSTYKAATYLFEYNSEQRAKEEARRNLVRAKLAEMHAPFIQVQSELKQKAAAQGAEYVPDRVMVHVPIVTYPEQWAVLVGGFKDMDSARQALNTVRTWKPPAATHLLDMATLSSEKKSEGAYINPYMTAMVFPNPAIRQATGNQSPAVDPVIFKLNEAEDLSPLKCKKPVTLMVKGFTLQTKVEQRGDDRSVMERLFNKGPDAGDQLDAAAKQARELAKAMRHPDFKPHPFEAYVLHIRNGSIVTVGQFDSADDPELRKVQYTLQWMKFEVRDTKDGPVKEMRQLFDNVYPMLIPRAQ